MLVRLKELFFIVNLSVICWIRCSVRKRGKLLKCVPITVQMFLSKTKDIHFMMIENSKKQQILTFKKL